MKRVTINLSTDSAKALRLLSEHTAVKHPTLLRLAVRIGLPDVIRQFGPAAGRLPSTKGGAK